MYLTGDLETDLDGVLDTYLTGDLELDLDTGLEPDLDLGLDDLEDLFDMAEPGLELFLLDTEESLLCLFDDDELSLDLDLSLLPFSVECFSLASSNFFIW